MIDRIKQAFADAVCWLIDKAMSAIFGGDWLENINIDEGDDIND